MVENRIAFLVKSLTTIRRYNQRRKNGNERRNRERMGNFFRTTQANE